MVKIVAGEQIKEEIQIGTSLTAPDHQGNIQSGIVKMMFVRDRMIWVVIDTENGVRTVKLV